jgi:hypothetical protein
MPFLFFQRRTFFAPQLWVKTRNGLAFFIMISLLTSCVSAKYKMASEDTPPPVPLNVSAEVHSVNALINTVIIFGGPGSWKRDAYWDEYILSITNHGEHPVALTSATLIDFQGNPVVSGDNPWELQDQSKAWVENYSSGTGGVIIKVGETSLLTGAIVGGSLAAMLSTSAFVTVSVGAVAALVAAGTVIALPVVGISSVLLNVSRKHKIEDEFNRRRIMLPVTIPPGQVTQGSLFFRITPGPQRLSLLFTGVDRGFDVSVDLKPLSDLHIDTKPKPKQAE